ncbi:hypothetical protein MKX03_025423 [Papaver bracteatum]|nr:hypothetical protein MKX03_025423 [Papaver bracteatum]
MEPLHHLQDPQHQMQNYHQLQLQQQQQQQVQYINIEDSGSGSSSSNSKNSSLLCRQNNTCSTTTTARWTPTSDQIRILKDLYYNNGVRSPTAEQIQRISAKLRQYGKIEGKNVFYWFQNHKARERQKKRFTLDMAAMQQQRSSTSSALSNGGGTGTIGVGLNYGGTRGGGNGGGWRHTDLHHPHDYYYAIENNHPTSNIHNPGIPSPTSPSSSHGMLTSVGPIGSSTASYGSVLMERRFRECSISAGGSSSIGNSTSNNIGSWVGVHQNHNTNNYHHQDIPTPQYPSYTATSSTLSTYSPAFVEKPPRILPIQLFKEEPDNHNEEEVTPEIETLPLFPMQTGDEDIEIPVENQTIPDYFSVSSNSETSNGYINHNPLTGYYIRSSSSVVLPLHDHHNHQHQELMNGGINLNRSASSSLELTLNSYTPITPDTVHGHHHQLN